MPFPIKPKDPKKPPVAWQAFIAARIAMYTKMAAQDDNWKRFYKMLEPTLKKELSAK